jgi:hypothetical protein
VITPFQIGLALQFYHDEFGSKQLIETLHAHGFCSSYDEVRRYLTSLANHEIDKIKKGVYVPNGIIPIASGGCLVQEGSANIDINTDISFWIFTAEKDFSTISQQINFVKVGGIE